MDQSPLTWTELKEFWGKLQKAFPRRHLSYSGAI